MNKEEGKNVSLLLIQIKEAEMKIGTMEKCIQINFGHPSSIVPSIGFSSNQIGFIELKNLAMDVLKKDLCRLEQKLDAY